MKTPVDLKQLAVRRDEPPGQPQRRRSRHVLARYVLPAVIVLGFAALLAWSARASFLPRQRVTVVPVLTSGTDLQQEGTPLFHAAGWVEPRPTPVLVTALAEGVIDKLLVVEGQEVEKGQAVAELVKDDAVLALQLAAAEKDLKDAELQTLHATVEKERLSLAQQIQSAQARADLARRELDSKKDLFAKGIISELDVRRADTAWTTASSVLEEWQGRRKAEEKAFAAQINAAKARLRIAAVSVQVADLRAKRMTITAPISGRVLALVARPGSRVMGLSGGTQQDASTVLSLYDPASLQVRADVRLEDVPRVQPKQKVTIQSAAVPGSLLKGLVLFATSQADTQKNTLQVKVLVDAPPPGLRPDMLVQVTFLAPRAPPAKGGATRTLRLIVPRHLVDSAGGAPQVWLADQAAGVARLRSIKLGAAAGDWVEVVEGLTPADKLIAGGREGLRDGQRIVVTGEESR